MESKDIFAPTHFGGDWARRFGIRLATLDIASGDRAHPLGERTRLHAVAPSRVFDSRGVSRRIPPGPSCGGAAPAGAIWNHPWVFEGRAGGDGCENTY